MKKVILSLMACALLFGESEGFYKSKYEYLFDRYTKVDKEAWENYLYKNKTEDICSQFITRIDKIDCEKDINKIEAEGNSLSKKRDEYSEKLMDLKFKMQDDLKVVPEWFTFKVK